MRDLIIAKLLEMMAASDGAGIPAYFDCDDDEYIRDEAGLTALSDETLLEVFETAFMQF